MREIRETKGYLILLPILGGILLGLGWRLSPWFLFLAWIPFFEIDVCLQQKKYSYGGLLFGGLMFLGLFIWHLIALTWLFEGHWGGALLLITFNCLLMLIPFILFRITRNAINEAYGYFSLVLYWLSFEFLNLHWGLAWPWLTLGNGLAPLHYFIQWYEITGVLGGSAWILCSNIFIFLAFNSKFSVHRKTFGIYWVLTFLIVYLYSLYNLNKEVKENSPLEISLVPLKLDPFKSEQPGPEALSEILNKHLSDLNANPDLVLLPDLGTVLNPSDYKEERTKELDKTLNQLSQKLPKASFLCGVYLHDPAVADQGPLSTALLLKDARVKSMRQRHRRVPGFEMPFLAIGSGLFRSWFQPGFYLGNSPEPNTNQAFSLGSEGDSIFLAPLLSYEILFGNVPRGISPQPLSFMVCMMDNAWWGNALSQRQLLSLAKIRAIESRKPILISANPGIPAFIDRNGRIQSNLDATPGRPFSIQLRPNAKTSFYTRFGDYLGRLSWFLAIALFLSGLVRKKTKK